MASSSNASGGPSNWAKAYSVNTPPSTTKKTSEEDWAVLKDRILDLHLKQNIPLKQASNKIFEETGFIAKLSAYKYRLRMWSKSNELKLKHIMLTASQRQSLSSMLLQRKMLDKRSEIRYKDGTKIDNQGKIMRTLEKYKFQDKKNALPTSSPGAFCVVTPSPKEEIIDDMDMDHLACGVDVDIQTGGFEDSDAAVSSPRDALGQNVGHEIVGLKPDLAMSDAPVPEQASPASEVREGIVATSPAPIGPDAVDTVQSDTNNKSPQCDEGYPIGQLEVYFGEMRALVLPAFEWDPAPHDGLVRMVEFCNGDWSLGINSPFSDVVDEARRMILLHATADPATVPEELRHTKHYAYYLDSLISIIFHFHRASIISKITVRMSTTRSKEEATLRHKLADLQREGCLAIMSGKDITIAMQYFADALLMFQHGNLPIRGELDVLFHLYNMAMLLGEYCTTSEAAHMYILVLRLQEQLLGKFHRETLAVRERLQALTFKAASSRDGDNDIADLAFSAYHDYLLCWEQVFFKELTCEKHRRPEELEDLSQQILWAYPTLNLLHSLSNTLRYPYGFLLKPSQQGELIHIFERFAFRLPRPEQISLPTKIFAFDFILSFAKTLFLVTKNYSTTACGKGDLMDSLAEFHQEMRTLLNVEADTSMESWTTRSTYTLFSKVEILNGNLLEAENSLKKVTESTGGLLDGSVPIWDYGCTICGKNEEEREKETPPGPRDVYWIMCCQCRHGCCPSSCMHEFFAKHVHPRTACVKILRDCTIVRILS